MAVKNRAQILTDINNLITTNGNKEITGAQLNGILQDVIDSALVQLDDTAFFEGLSEHDPAKSYATGEGVIYQSEIYQATENISPSGFDVSKWKKLTNNLDVQESFDFVPYDNLATYNTGDRVEYLNKLFKCDVDNTTGIIPEDSSPNWTEVSASSGTFGDDWVSNTYYLQNVVVSNNNKLYYLTVDTSVDPYLSTDIMNEIIAGDWEQFNTSFGGITGAENNFITFNNLGEEVETDEIQKDGASIAIKTLLKILGTGAGIEVNKDGWIDLTGGLDEAGIYYSIADNKLIIYSNNEIKFNPGAGGKRVEIPLPKIFKGTGNFGVSLDQNVTANRTQILPDKDGTFAMTSDIPSNAGVKTYISTAQGTNTGGVVGSATDPNLTFVFPSNGNYIVEGTITFWLFGNVTAQAFPVVNNVLYEVNSFSEVQNNQGGGAARQVIHTVPFFVKLDNMVAGQSFEIAYTQSGAGQLTFAYRRVSLYKIQ